MINSGGKAVQEKKKYFSLVSFDPVVLQGEIKRQK